MRERSFRLLTAAASLWGLAAGLAVLVYVLTAGVPALFRLSMWGFRWQPDAGAYGAMGFFLGTLCATALGMALALPLGVGTALYLFCRPRQGLVHAAVSLLSCCPTVVTGIYGLRVLCPLVQRLLGGSGSCLLSAALVLAVVGLPTMSLLTLDALRRDGQSVLTAALALGLPRESAALRLALPHCGSAVGHAAVTAGLRLLGETTAVLLVCGNSETGPAGLLAPVRTLCTGIALEMGYAAGDHRAALYGFGAALLLLSLSVLAGKEALCAR